MLVPTERMPVAPSKPRPLGMEDVLPHRPVQSHPTTDPTMTPVLPERTWLELAPRERDELVAAHVDRWSPEDGPALRYSQEYRLALSLVKRLHVNPYYRSLLGNLLFSRLCGRLGFTGPDQPKTLEIEQILCGLEPADIAWAYLEAFGEAPRYGEAAPEDTFLL